MTTTSTQRKYLQLFAMLVVLLAPSWAGAIDLLPDIIVRESDLYDHDIVTNISPGRVHLRLSNGTPNVGDGKLYLFGLLPPIDDTTQQVMQRVYDDVGGFTDRLSGLFIFHDNHSHIHFEGWSQYRLRELLADDSVGAVVAAGEKTSFCVADFAIYDNTLPNFDPNGQFFTCSGTVQGLSVGWLDVYSKSLPDQWIDITGVPDGEYWLESESDPDDHILEKDETNNITRIKVIVGTPEAINPDSYEPNNTQFEVDGRPVGGFNSPNLGPCDPVRTITELTVHESFNDDYFKFYMNDTGTPSDYIRIDFVHSQGDLDLKLLNSIGSQEGVSQTITNQENISLDGKPEGWYYAHIYGYNGALSAEYTLTIDPPLNTPPVVDVVMPPAGDTSIVHGVDTYTATWAHSDPESDETWVTLYLNKAPTLDGNEILLVTTLNTDSDIGFAVVNTAYADTGTYWVYCTITDGGTTTGDWSEGTITFVDQQDTDSDAIPDASDNCPYYANPTQETCGQLGELTGDGFIDNLDLNRLIDHLFFGVSGLPVDVGCPHIDRGDLNCDGVDDSLDLNAMIDYIFFGGSPPCDPCACINYPVDCP